MIDENVIFEDGSMYTSREIMESVSISLFQSHLHYEISEFVAQTYTDSPVDLKKVIENIYATKSDRIRVMTAFIWFVCFHIKEIKKIEINKDLLDVINFKDLEVKELVCLGDFTGQYIQRSQVKNLFLKAVASSLFRFFSKKMIPKSSLVRGWVDVTEAMYGEVMPTSSIRVFPFPFGIVRQARFVFRCYKRGYNVSLDGIPYSITKIIRLCFSKKDFDLKFAQIELEANEKYSKKLLNVNPVKIYTSDEFEVASFAMYNPLIAFGVSVINTAHGVGLYCPNVAYSCFRGFSVVQNDFYSKNGKLFGTEIRDFNNTNLPLPFRGEKKRGGTALVLLHQNFSDYKLKGDAIALEKIANELNKIAGELKIDYYVKLHPNVKARSVGSISNKMKGKVIDGWEFLAGMNLIFIVINSTAFFEVIKHGPVLVYKGPSFFPEIYFGYNINTFNLDSLSVKINNIIEEGVLNAQ